MTMHKAGSQLQEHKDVLQQYMSSGKKEAKSSWTSRGESPSTLRFSTTDGDCSFPYAYVQYVRFYRGAITVRTSTAKIVINGKNLRPLYLEIERYKTDSVIESSTTMTDDEQPIVDTITINFDED
ncbi:hypothetical protein [Sessilibacter corallicola]|uniref:Uncharacterized protein n=1 Tax=Sessilibacter corallicola TaxID=2904075 RepID=A0ABQ0A9K5_9GAMM